MVNQITKTQALICYVLPYFFLNLSLKKKQNQVANLRQKKIEANFLNSTQTNKEAIMNDLKKKVPQTKLLYITPEMMTLSSNTLKVLKSLYLRDLVSLVVVDEAHCISTWGHDFRSSYRKLSVLRTMFEKTPIMVLRPTPTTVVPLIFFVYIFLFVGAHSNGNKEVHAHLPHYIQ